jgi:hypothetical protein
MPLVKISDIEAFEAWDDDVDVQETDFSNGDHMILDNNMSTLDALADAASNVSDTSMCSVRIVSTKPKPAPIFATKAHKKNLDIIMNLPDDKLDGFIKELLGYKFRGVHNGIIKSIIESQTRLAELYFDPNREISLRDYRIEEFILTFIKWYNNRSSNRSGQIWYVTVLSTELQDYLCAGTKDIRVHRTIRHGDPDFVPRTKRCRKQSQDEFEKPVTRPAPNHEDFTEHVLPEISLSESEKDRTHELAQQVDILTQQNQMLLEMLSQFKK